MINDFLQWFYEKSSIFKTNKKFSHWMLLWPNVCICMAFDKTKMTETSRAIWYCQNATNLRLRSKKRNLATKYTNPNTIHSYLFSLKNINYLQATELDQSSPSTWLFLSSTNWNSLVTLQGTMPHPVNRQNFWHPFPFWFWRRRRDFVSRIEALLRYFWPIGRKQKVLTEEVIGWVFLP